MPTSSKSNRVPKYRLHKSDGRAVVTLNGQDVFLGKYGTPESQTRYSRLIAEWVAAGRRLPHQEEDLTVLELIDAYWVHAEQTYRKPDGSPAGELVNIRLAMRPLKELYADVPVKAFGPRALRAVQQKMVESGWVRTSINRQTSRLKSMFKWAVSQELIPGGIYHALLAVDGLRRGRSEAKEANPVKPVPEHLINGVLPLVATQVKAMIEFQLLTGARPTETCIMRTCDIDTNSKVWVYRPAEHKTQHHGHAREIRLGPKAQRIIAPFLKPDLQAYIFSPADAEAQRHALMRQEHPGPRTPSRVERSQQAARRKRQRPPGDRYDKDSYCRAIQRACDEASPLPEDLARIRVPARGRKTEALRWETDKEWKDRLGKENWAAACQWIKEHRWHPHQLRHNAATNLRRLYGLEAARLVLGHHSAAVTEIYAEMDAAKAEQIMAEVG